MSLWYRVFSRSDAKIDPNSFLEYLHNTNYPVQAKFLKDEQGWFEATFAFEENELTLQRYLTIEKGVRAELNAFAAWIESQETDLNQMELMERVIAAPQIFAFELPEEQANIEKVRAFCYHVVKFLARETEGLMQVDGEGVYDEEGTFLIPE